MSARILFTVSDLFSAVARDYNQFDVHNDNFINHDYLSPSIAEDEVCFEDTVNNFHVDDNTLHASSSYIPPVPQEFRSGSSFLSDFLLQNHMSGITASPFLANQHCRSLFPFMASLCMVYPTTNIRAFYFNTFLEEVVFNILISMIILRVVTLHEALLWLRK